MDALNTKSILITGGAGFVGCSLAKKLLATTTADITIADNLNDYYQPSLKKARLKDLGVNSKLRFIKIDIVDPSKTKDLFKKDYDIVVHLAAQPGVTYARENPRAYIEANINGFFNIIDETSRHKSRFFLYASSSSVYGANNNLPWQETEVCDDPLSLYAATKLSNELLAQTYSRTKGLACLGVRLFNVYGPWGRPDMAYYKWTEAILSGKPIELRGGGQMKRDMTYIDDVVKAIMNLMAKYCDDLSNLGDEIKHDIFNIGHSDPVPIMELLNYISSSLGQPPKIISAPQGEDEITTTYADNSKLKEAIGYIPDTNYTQGLDEFTKWLKQHKAEAP